MNIFRVDNHPQTAAVSLCNKHVIKQILESAQLLCTAHRVMPILKEHFPANLYKATHINHPIGIWVRKSSRNYIWLVKHALALCDEYTYRYDKIHASKPIIDWCMNFIPFDIFSEETEQPQCMPDEYKKPSVVDGYRNYYLNHKRHTIKMEWRKRKPPEWWTNA